LGKGREGSNFLSKWSGKEDNPTVLNRSRPFSLEGKKGRGGGGKKSKEVEGRRRSP